MRVDDVAGMGQADVARHVIECHVTLETWIQNAQDDVASYVPDLSWGW
jgi:hypothetical protein